MKRIILLFCVVVLIAMALSSFNEAAPKEITIGNQVWMTENLNVEEFRNGDPIPEAKTEEEWANAGENKQPAWCYYDNDPVNGTRYGKLYNWYAVNDPRGLAPDGYRIPRDSELTKLEDFLGSNAGKKMKSATGWHEGGNGDNSSRFSGLPGGDRDGSGMFFGIGQYGYWWGATEADSNSAWCRNLYYLDGSMGKNKGFKVNGFSVRCLKE